MVTPPTAAQLTLQQRLQKVLLALFVLLWLIGISCWLCLAGVGRAPQHLYMQA